MLDYLGDRLDPDSGRQLTEFALSNEKFTSTKLKYFKHERVKFDPNALKDWTPPAYLENIDKPEMMEVDTPSSSSSKIKNHIDTAFYGKAANRVIYYPPSKPAKKIPEEETKARKRKSKAQKENIFENKAKVQKPITSFVSAKTELYRQAAVQNKDPPSLSPQNGARSVKVPSFSTPYAKSVSFNKTEDEEEERDGIKGIDKKLVEIIENEIMSTKKTMKWDEIAGLKTAKEAINYAVIAPMKRPDLFTGIRSAPKGVLLFGPPGTGKTLIGKCIASQAGATFFSISASSMTSKWIGEGEKLVKVLFTLAQRKAPSVVFVDEIDSLLSARTDGEHDASRRIKTEFLVQLDGCRESEDGKTVLLIGATNRPECLDEAARRRLTRRLYIPLPCDDARRQIINDLLKDQQHTLRSKDFNALVKGTEGYSGADLNTLCREAALMPMKNISLDDLEVGQMPAIDVEHFKSALALVRPSVEKSEIVRYEEFQKKFGC